jgi:AraC-like DNA-binding protein
MIVVPDLIADPLSRSPVTTMDAIADLLRSMHLTSGVFLDAEFTAPWCVSARVGPEDCGPFGPVPRSIIAFHYVSEGELQLQVEGGAPHAIGPGSIVVLPRNDPHLLGSDVGLAPIAADELIQPGADGRLANICHGGGGARTRLVCGFLGTDRPNDPVLLMLPAVMALRVEDEASAAWIGSSFRYAALGPSAAHERASEVLVRLAEARFVDAMRRYLATLPSGQAQWCGGMADPPIAKALGLLHGRMRHRWTTEELAGEVGLSRSAFAEQFSRAMGESPMRYLSQQRLLVASRRLRESRDSLARIAFETGYESEAAFSRAFRRAFGLPPATWRNQRLP